MIKISDRADCCGCGACSQICPQQCIKMNADEEGFLYPKIDEETCVNCGLCNKVCPVIKIADDREEKKEPPTAYAMYHKNEQVRLDSSSGGAFTLLAEYVLSKGGLVYGCKLDHNMCAVHVGINDISKIAELRGSKYVQSEIGNTYIEIREALEKDKKVLFVGTPCQTAGLYYFLDCKKFSNLYIVDFICHGVPSPLVFSKFIVEEEKKQDSKMIVHKFRNKDHGWNQTGLQPGTYSCFANGISKRRYPAFKDSFMNGFLDDIYLRPSCYSCKFKVIPKFYSDITIADFWGIDKVLPEMNDNKGTSLVLVNTEQGDKIWEAIRDNSVFQAVEVNKAIRKNRSLVESAELNPNRSKFFSELSRKGFAFVERKYMSAATWAFHKIIKIVKRILHPFEQFIKFAIVGCSNTLINLATYYFLIYMGMHYMPAYTLAFLISVCNAFCWNNKYVFKNKQEKNVYKAFIKVFSSYGLSYLLSLALMGVMVEILNISSYIAPIFKMVITIPMNFALNKVWAFRDRSV